MLIVFCVCVNNNNLNVLRKYHLVSLSRGFMCTKLTYVLAKVSFCKRVTVAILIILFIQLNIQL